MNTRVKELSLLKGISYASIAAKIGVVPKTVTNWTTGKRAFNLESLNDVSEALNCEPHELLECGVNYTHAYSPEGEWLGIIKK